MFFPFFFGHFLCEESARFRALSLKFHRGLLPVTDVSGVGIGVYCEMNAYTKSAECFSQYVSSFHAKGRLFWPTTLRIFASYFLLSGVCTRGTGWVSVKTKQSNGEDLIKVSELLINCRLEVITVSHKYVDGLLSDARDTSSGVLGPS